MHLRFLYLFLWLNTSFFFYLIIFKGLDKTLLFDVSVYLFTYWRTFWLLQLWMKLFWTSVAGFCVDVSFQVIWVNTKVCKLLDHTVRLCLLLWETALLSSKGTILFAFFSLPINESSHGLTLCQQHLELSGFQTLAILIGYCFNLQFSNGIWHWATFHMLLCYMVLKIPEVLIILKREWYKTLNDSEESVWIFVENLLENHI